MWSYQDLHIIKVCFAANGLDGLPNARITSSNMHTPFSRENKRPRKSSWASSVQRTTHIGIGKDEAGRFSCLNQLVTLTSWKRNIAFACVCSLSFYEGAVSLVRRKYHPWGESIGSRHWGLFLLRIPNHSSADKLKKNKIERGSWWMRKAHSEWHTANKTNSLSEQQRISQKPLSFE